MNVLYWGYRDNAPVPYFRGTQFQPYMAEMGINAIYSDISQGRPDVSLDWPDVVVFRRYYPDDMAGISAEAWELAGIHAARVYDADDWDLGTPAFHTWSPKVEASRPMIERMLREADLVTVSTPQLASKYREYARREPVVVRNAVDPELYSPDEPRADDRVTALFYGTDTRIRDYWGAPDERGKWRGGFAREAIRSMPELRSVWLGSAGGVTNEFDEVVLYDENMRRFFRALGNAHADIGLAPLAGDGFDLCKSELHWLEMTAAGMPVIAQRFMGGGPYGVIRDGVDGLLVRGRQDWYDAVRRLARDAELRADLVAAARERMADDYSPKARAALWAEAFGEARA